MTRTHRGRTAAAAVAALALVAAGGGIAVADEPGPITVAIPVGDDAVTVVVAPSAPASAPTSAAPAPTSPATQPPVRPAPPPPQPAPPPTTPSSRSSSTTNSAPATAQATPTSTPTSGGLTTRQESAGATLASGLPWRLGMFAHDEKDGKKVEAFEAASGRSVDILSMAPERGSWASILGEGDSGWWYKRRADGGRVPDDFRGVLEVAVPMWPQDGNLTAAASGEYDANWAALGKLLQEHYPGSTARIGWEFNIGWYYGAKPETAEQWKTAWQKASVALKSTCPTCLTAWVPNKGKMGELPDPTAVWPGDEYVDLVGIDAYDWWPGYTAETWPEHRDGEQGWQHWIDFARQHGKRFTLPEFGVAPGNSSGGGDNPFYINTVLDYLYQNRDVVYSVIYFDEPDDYIRNSISGGQVPQATAAWKAKLAGIAASSQKAGDVPVVVRSPNTATPGQGQQPQVAAGAVPCPPATVKAATTEQLQAALDAAQPGTSIAVADGTYGAVSARASGTPTRPVTLCGGVEAVIDGGAQPAVTIDNAQAVQVLGVALRSQGDNALSGRAAAGLLVQGVTADKAITLDQESRYSTIAASRAMAITAAGQGSVVTSDNAIGQEAAAPSAPVAPPPSATVTRPPVAPTTPSSSTSPNPAGGDSWGKDVNGRGPIPGGG